MKAKEREAMRGRVHRLCRALGLDMPSILYLAEIVAESEIDRERRRARKTRGAK